MIDFEILVIKLLTLILEVVWDEYSVDADRVNTTILQARDYQMSKTRQLNAMTDSGSPQWSDTDDPGGHA